MSVKVKINISDIIVEIAVQRFTVNALYMAVSSITKVSTSYFRLFHHGSYLTNLEAKLPSIIDDGEVVCIFLLKGGFQSSAEIAHPGKPCEKCAKCNATTSTRWCHKGLNSQNICSG